MFPRWFYALVAAELAGIAAAVVVGIHLVADGTQAVGNAVSWAAPYVRPGGGLPSLSLPLPVPSAAPTPTPRTPVQVIRSGNGLLDTLNGSTRTVTLGQIQLVDEISRALRGYIEHQIAAASGGG